MRGGGGRMRGGRGELDEGASSCMPKFERLGEGGKGGWSTHLAGEWRHWPAEQVA